MVFIRDPAVQREAIAEEQGTLVLAIGGKPGAPYEVSAWETVFYAIPAVARRALGRGDRADTRRRSRSARTTRRCSTTSPAPRAAAGRPTRRWRTSSRRSRGDAEVERATPQTDPDFDAIRGDARLPGAESLA